jgi:hypothetical protein
VGPTGHHTDPTGHWIESVFDILSIGYGIYDISQNGLNWENGLGLAADVVGLALPGVTGLGAVVRVAAKADDAVDAVRAVNAAGNVVQTANQVDKVADGTQTYRAVTDGYPFNWKPTRNDISGTPPGLSCSVGCEGMGYQDIFEMSVNRPAGSGDNLYQVHTSTLQNSPFGLTPDPIPGQNPYHAVTGGDLANQWTNSVKREFQSYWDKVWSYKGP